MFKIIKKYSRRYCTFFILAHLFLAGMVPLLHAHSATPVSVSHPGTIHVHLLFQAPEMSICSLTGNEQFIYTAEPSDSRQSDDVLDDATYLRVVYAYPAMVNYDHSLAATSANVGPGDLTKIHPRNSDAQLNPPNPQAP
jgi:hypothetical protein